EQYFRDLGASSIVPRDELTKKPSPLQSERWAGGVDTVGGDTLANVFAQTAYEGAIACCGMAQSHELNTTVWPLILRNVSLLGVSSIKTSKAKRIAACKRLAGGIDPAAVAKVSRNEPPPQAVECNLAPMIERETNDGIVTLRLAHGKASALDVELCGAIIESLNDARDARAVILTGTGSIFSAGVDLFRMTNEGAPYI